MQLLENGNYLICTLGNGGGWESSIIEITPEGDMVWKLTDEGNSNFYRDYNIHSIQPNAFSVIYDQNRNLNIQWVILSKNDLKTKN